MPGNLLEFSHIYTFFILFAHSKLVSLSLSLSPPPPPRLLFLPAIFHVNLVAKLWNPLRRTILLCLQNIYIWGLSYTRELYLKNVFHFKISLMIPGARPLWTKAKSFSVTTDLHSLWWVDFTFCFPKQGKAVIVPPLMCFLASEL